DGVNRKVLQVQATLSALGDNIFSGRRQGSLFDPPVAVLRYSSAGSFVAKAPGFLVAATSKVFTRKYKWIRDGRPAVRRSGRRMPFIKRAAEYGTTPDARYKRKAVVVLRPFLRRTIPLHCPNSPSLSWSHDQTIRGMDR